LWSSLSDTAHVSVARKYVGVIERGANRGVDIDRWNKTVGNPLGSPYCAAFTYSCLKYAGYSPVVRSGLANSYRVKNSYSFRDVLFKGIQVKKGDLVIWQRGKTIFGHIGIAESDWTTTKGRVIEANTSPGTMGSQYNGHGVFIRNRSIEPYNWFRIVAFTRIKDICLQLAK
jgi:hypothetical protein